LTVDCPQPIVVTSNLLLHSSIGIGYSILKKYQVSSIKYEVQSTK
jgi:hypothetical protein